MYPDWHRLVDYAETQGEGTKPFSQRGMFVSPFEFPATVDSPSQSVILYDPSGRQASPRSNSNSESK